MMEPSDLPFYGETVDDEEKQLKLSVTSEDPTEDAKSHISRGSKIGNSQEEKKQHSSSGASTKTIESNAAGPEESVDKNRIGRIYQMKVKGNRNKIALVNSPPGSPTSSSRPFRVGSKSPRNDLSKQLPIPPSRLRSLQRKQRDAIKEHFKETDNNKMEQGTEIVKEQAEAHDEDQITTWKDVWMSCCCHTKSEWVSISSGILSLVLCLYVFLFALELLGTSFKVVGGCTAGSLLGSDTNPLASVCVGIIATALLQSSSTTTAIVVSLVSGGLDVKQGIYLVMGANVGTSITCMMVSLSHMGDGQELEQAFSGSSLLYVFNFFTICILFPLELISGYLFRFSKLGFLGLVYEWNPLVWTTKPF